MSHNMLSATILVVLAFAAQLLAISPDKCVILKTGDISGTETPLARTVLDQPVAQWLVGIPNICEPQGVVASVCDYDETPTTKFIDALNLQVERKGGLLYPATVDITVYCKNTRRLINLHKSLAVPGV